MKKKYVLITGSSRGIGRACAVAFAKNGYHVFINCKNSVEQLAETEREILASGGCCTALPGDVSDPDVVRSIFRKIKEICQGVDVLVNNAGISHFGLLSDLSDSEWKNLIDTNLSSAFYCCREAIPHMVSEKCGKIINISSMNAYTPLTKIPAYSGRFLRSRLFRFQIRTPRPDESFGKRACAKRHFGKRRCLRRH